MNKETIKQPKVFISYAWGEPEYQERVLAFASELVNDGIDVMLDRWSLKEGNDTYAFMEQSVTDQSITNVLILLSPQYEMKANGRSGGVGTETQIISPEIYNKVKQDKFLPIIFERGINGEVPKPTYLKTLLHFDLSIAENYDDEYRRLVKSLYGIEIIKKPELGSRPDWLESTYAVSSKTRVTYKVLKTNLPSKEKSSQFVFFLSEFKQRIINFRQNEENRCEDYIALYAETKSIRDDFLLLMRYISYIDQGERLVANTLEDICCEVSNSVGLISDIQKTLLHELFIYLVAIYYKSKNYNALSYMFTKIYYIGSGNDFIPETFNVFCENSEQLDRAICMRDGKNYYSGTANYWIENINIDVCSRKYFAFADLLCYNASFYTNTQLDSWYWIPLTYGYEEGVFKRSCIQMKSKEHLESFAFIFGFDNIESFKQKFFEVEKRFKNNELRPFRFSSAWRSAPMMCQYIKYDELGIYNV